MNRVGLLLTIAAITLVAVCVGIFELHARQRQHTFSDAAGRTQTQGNWRPFRSAVVELTFRSRSVQRGEEFFSSSGHGIEYIDAVGVRRREDFDRNQTIMRQLPSSATLTWIFDGANLYVVSDEDGKRSAHVTDMREGYDYRVWADSPVEELKLPGATVTQEEFLGRPCKVYLFTSSVGTAKSWVWHGVTLRSESHIEQKDLVMEMAEEASRVEEDVDIDPSLFSPPTDVTFEPVKLTAAQQLDHHKSAPWVRVIADPTMF